MSIIQHLRSDQLTLLTTVYGWVNTQNKHGKIVRGRACRIELMKKVEQLSCYMFPLCKYYNMTEISCNILLHKIYKEAIYGSLLCTQDGIPHPHPFSSVYLLSPLATKLNDSGP